VRSGEPDLKYGPSVRAGVGRPEQVDVPWPVWDAGVAEVADGADAVWAGGGEADDGPAGPAQAPRTTAASSPRAALAAAL
jgi:hypothetical protein